MWILLLLWTLPAQALVSDEINRACQKEPAVYRACLSNLENQYAVGYRAFDLFAWLAGKSGASIPLKTGVGPRVETGVALDLALDGPGYFRLSRGRLVRSAAFRLRGGRLCTSEGGRLLGYAPNSPQLQEIGVPQNAIYLQIDSRGNLSWTDPDGDGRPQEGGRLAVGLVAHPEWLRQAGAELTPNNASGPVLACTARVLSGQLELSNGSALEQQKTCAALFAYAGLAGSQATPKPGPARRDLLRVIAQHDARCAASMANLKHQSDPGFRASDVLVRDQRGFRLRVNQGTLRETKDPYNLAIEGEGYFVLEGGLLTRSGNFSMDRDGQLVSQDGLALMGTDGRVRIRADMSNIEVKADGTIMGTALNGDGRAEQAGALMLGRVSDPGWLERVGPHLRVTPESGPVRLQTPGKDGCGVVAQGYLENSNLSAIEQMKTLSALRNYARLLGMPLSDDYQP
ncbi:hypothetical protein ABS71_01815 [bacterium SCN 62-11]|nr:hypothetical protein [Candidatus Eremiobacteraeota bacterium]ODT78489.1 MAG: hypothetical protein ABS71_01815 [bacterium SCN 62-11]